MFIFPRVIVDLQHLCFGDITGIYAAYSLTKLVHMQHDLCRLFAIMLEDGFQYVNDEFHRCVVIVNQDNLE